MSLIWEDRAVKALQKARHRHSQFVLRISLLILAQFVTIVYLVLRLTEKGCS